MKATNRRKTALIFIALTWGITWLLQFFPMILGMDITGTSISSFDYSSIFFGIGGMMPTLLGVIFVFALYEKSEIIDFIKRCFVPNLQCLWCILISLALISLESAATQLVSKCFGAEPLGFEGLKLIIQQPLYFFYFLFWGLISGPLSEEVGWRGFLTDTLWDKTKVTRISLIIGAVWGLWHLPLTFYPAQIQYEWWQVSPLLSLGFIANCMTNALVYSAVYVASRRKIFPIFFLHMFENIILTGAMIYPFSDTYKIAVIPVSIVLDVVFYVVFTRTKFYLNGLEVIYIPRHENQIV